MRDIELGGERNRGLYVLKSRGMKHSNQIREFLMTSDGIKLEEVYVGAEGVLTGSMRAAQEEREKAAALAREQDLERKERKLNGRRAALEAQIAALRAEFQSVEDEAALVKTQDKSREQRIMEERTAAQKRREGEAGKPTQGNGKRNRK